PAPVLFALFLPGRYRVARGVIDQTEHVLLGVEAEPQLPRHQRAGPRRADGRVGPLAQAEALDRGVEESVLRVEEEILGYPHPGILVALVVVVALPGVFGGDL